MTARIYISGALYHLDKPYDYLVPPDIAENIRPGMRVRIPFGMGNRQRVGLVVELFPDGEGAGLKPVAAIVDDEPLLDKEMLALCAFVKERWYCTFFESAALMLPPGSSARCLERVILKEGIDIPPSVLENRSLISLISFLEEQGGSALREELDPAFERAGSLISRLKSLGIIEIDCEMPRQAGEKRVRMVSLAVSEGEAEEYLARVKGRGRQGQVLELLLEQGDMTLSEIMYMTGVSEGVVKRLHNAGILSISKRVMEPSYDEEAGSCPLSHPDEITLDGDQQAAFSSLLDRYNKGEAGCMLLWGVTGSGKTMVFLKLISEVLKSGKRAMLLVPEIALTPRMVALFKGCFRGAVAVMHSAMSQKERLSAWKRVKSGEASIVIGTRLSVFAPMCNIGIIIMDEEQEGAYKSERSPRYHAREVAKKRCVQNGALLVLCSATPLIESRYSAETGRYGMVSLPRRFGGAKLPQVSIVNMADELRAGNRSIYSRAMAAALMDTFEKGHQSIIFLNRRGHSTFVSCRECGYVDICPNCEIPVTYHMDNNRLMCHYCGHSHDNLTICPKCQSRYIKFVGSGTQRAEDELSSLLPGAKVIRMDGDSTSLRHSHDEILTSFGNREGDVLLGTQMVVKGLNFDNVTFVGVLNADQMLYSSDFRAGETAFSMLTQVVGRAGRGSHGGRAMIQTYSPLHPILQNAANQDYDTFYKEEIELRRRMGYPPFFDLCVITISGPFENRVKQGIIEAGERISALLDAALPGRYKLTGPAPSPMVRMNNRFRWRIIIRCNDTRPFREAMSRYLTEFYADRSKKELSIMVDTNPYNFF